MLSPLRRVLLAPREFFDERSDEPGRLGPVALVFALGLFPLAAQVALTSAIPGGGGDQLSYAAGGTTAAVGVAALAGALASVSSTVVQWLLYASVMYLATSPFATESGFTRNLLCVAWGFAPSLVGETLWLGAILVGIATTPAPETTAGAAEFVVAVQSTPLMVAVGAANVLIALWVGALWLLAVERTRGVSRRVAAVAVAVPVLVRLTISVGSLLRAFGG